MADFDSSLPVRTQNAGDVISKIADAVNPAQQLAVDAMGLIGSKIYASNGDSLEADLGRLKVLAEATDLDIRDLVAATDSVSAHLKDGAGTAITSTTVGAKQALDVALKDENGNALGSAMYPLATAVSPNGIGDGVYQREVEASVAQNATGVNTYTVPAGKVGFLKGIKASASGKLKAFVEYSLDGVAFLPLYDAFNSTATPNVELTPNAELMIPAGGKVKVTLTNKDLLAQDLYSTIEVVEVLV